MKIKNKIILSFGSVFLLVMLVLGMVVGFFSSRMFHTQVNNSLQAIVIEKAERVRTYLNGQKEFVAGLASSLVLRDYLGATVDSAEFKLIKEKEEARLIETLRVNPAILEFEILDKNGMVVIATGKTLVGSDKSMDSYFVNGKNEIFIKDFYFSETYKQLIYAVSAPIRDNDGQLLGVVVARYNPADFNEIVGGTTGLGKTGESFLVNKDKYFITPSKYWGEEAILKQKVETQNVENCFNSEEIEAMKRFGYDGGYSTKAVQEYVDYRGVPILGTHAYIPETSWCLIGKIDAKEVFAPSMTQGYVFGIFTIVATVVFLVLGLLISQLISKPIEVLKKGMEIVGGGNLNYRVGTKSTDEIGDLSRAFDHMTEMIKVSRAEVDAKVEEQTREIRSKSGDLEEQQKAIINVLEDVEEERRISERQALDLRKFQQAVENATDHMVITDAEGIVLYANQAVSKITGFDIKDVLGKKAGSPALWGGLMPKSFYEKLWKQVKEEKTPFVGELTNRRKTGEEYMAQVSISPVMDKEGKVVFFVGVERDITKAKEVDRMKTEFVSLVTHQLRTPITAVNWSLEMLAEGDGGELSERQKEIVKNALDSNGHMSDLVKSLLNISRIESGRIMVEPEPTVLTELVNGVIAELLPMTKEKNTKVELSSSYNTSVNIDPKLIREVYKNFLTNAVKYSDTGGVVKINISKEGEEIVSRVSDSGYGIPRGEQEHLFQKFFRASNIVEKVSEGTGLGLYLTKQIVEASGGKIGFESEEGKGSTFWFSVPVSGTVAKKGEVSIS